MLSLLKHVPPSFVGVNPSSGSYKDEVLCDVVPMEVTHVLLGRPWQFDKQKSLLMSDIFDL